MDSLTPIPEARAKMGANKIVLGNVNPVAVLRNGNPDSVRETLTQCYCDAGKRFIIGAGCEVPRDTPHENLRALCAGA